MSSSAPSNLIRPRNFFTGRDSDSQALTELMRNGRLVTIVGPGGCGKTRLSIEWASHHLQDFPSGVWFIDLSNISDESYIPEHVARVAGLRLSGAEAPIQAVIRELSATESLLILDNCEHLIEAATRFGTEFLSHPGDAKILATSRRRLEAPGEAELELNPLPWPEPRASLDAVEARSFGACMLLRDRARQQIADFELVDGNAYTVASVCKKLDGLPLAIELAAARIGELSLEQVNAKLERMLAFLTTGPRSKPPRQQTLRALVDWSYSLLSPEEQTLLAVLAVFAGGWTVDAARLLMELSTGKPAKVEPWLATLHKESLISEQTDGRRFSMLSTVRQFGLEQLEARGLAKTARHAQAKWVRSLVDRFRPELASGNYEAAAKVLEPEHENIRAALAWSLQDRSDLDLPMGIIGDLARFWYQRGHGLEARQWIHRCLASCPPDGCTPALRMEALLCAIGLAGFEGDYRTGQRFTRELIDYAERHNDAHYLGMALHEDAKVTQFGIGDFDLAYTQYLRALDQFRELPESATERYAVSSSLALLESARGNYDSAIEHIHGALNAAVQAGDYQYRAFGRLGLASILDDSMRREEAAEAYEESLREAREYGMRTLELNVLHPYSRMRLDLDLVDAGREGYRLAERLAGEMGDRLRLSFARSGLARAHAQAGDAETAANYLSEWESMIGAPADTLMIERLYAASLLALARGKRAEALSILQCVKNRRAEIPWSIPPSERFRWAKVEAACAGAQPGLTEPGYEEAMRFALNG